MFLLPQQAEIKVDLHVELERMKEELLLQRAAGSVGAGTVGGPVEETNEIHWRAVVQRQAAALLPLPVGSEHLRAMKQNISLMEDQHNTAWVIGSAHRSPAHHYSYLFSPALCAPRATHLSCILLSVDKEVYMKPNKPWIITIIDASKRLFTVKALSLQ